MTAARSLTLLLVGGAQADDDLRLVDLCMPVSMLGVNMLLQFEHPREFS